jgi:hypothetical protein
LSYHLGVGTLQGPGLWTMRNRGCGPLAAPDSSTIDRLVGLLNTKTRRCGADPKITLSSHLCNSTSLICSKYCASKRLRWTSSYTPFLE